jgi:hypothetical protein
LTRRAHVEPRECVALKMGNGPRYEAERVAVEVACMVKSTGRDYEVDMVNSGDHRDDAGRK